MDFDYEVYEKKRDSIHEENGKHLAGFEKWLKKDGLSEKTITKHISNAEFYINDFLCYYDAEEVQQGCYSVSQFLGDWFIRKTMWASCSEIKSNAASFKKFYAYLLTVNVIAEKDYEILCSTIKEELPQWLDTLRRYDGMLNDDEEWF